MKKINFFGIIFFILFINNVFAQENIDSLTSFEKIIKQRGNHFNNNYISKNIDPGGSGFKQFMVEKLYYEMNKSSMPNFTEQRRWNTYKENKFQFLNKGGKQIVSKWINLGPNTIDSLGGRMICHAFDPVNPEILWAGSSTGGIWKTTNGGTNWESMTDQLPSMIISDIEINPTNRNVILVGTGNDKFLSITLGPGVGVLKSVDGGMTWYQTLFNYQIGENISVSKLAWKPGSKDSVYMAASNGIWLSEDSGETWTLLKSGRCASVVIDENSPNNIYSVIFGSGVYKSTDAGTTWNLLTNGVQHGSIVGFSSIAISKTNPSTLYVSISNPNTFNSVGLYKTTDSGNTWLKLTNAPDPFCAPNQPTICQGWFVNVVSISPFDENLIFYGGITFWRSINGGNSWSQHDVYPVLGSSGASAAGRTYVDQWDIGFHPSDPNIIYVFNDGGIFKSTNKGTWWNKKNNGLVTAQIHKIASSATDTTLIIGGFQDHGLQKLSNVGGNTFWKRWSDNDGTNVIIDPKNNNIFYGDFFLGNHRKSTNGGATSRSSFAINNGITEGGVLIPPLIMNPVETSTLYTSSVSKIYKTTNGGSFWSAVANIPNVYTMSIDQINPDIVYAHSYSNTSWSIWKSTNAGINWGVINNSTIPSWRVTDLETDPNTSGVIYATRNSAFPNTDHVKKSTDFGETWIDITGNLPDIFVYAIAISSHNNNHLYLATELGVYASTTGGTDWFPFNEGLPIVRTYDIHYHPIDRTIRIATIGRGVWKAKEIDFITSVDKKVSEIPGDFVLYQNYPNPFNNSTTIKYDLNKQSNLKIIVSDQIGQVVETLYDGNQPAGSYTILWDTNLKSKNLSSGIYFIRIIANYYSQTIKIILLK